MPAGGLAAAALDVAQLLQEWTARRAQGAAALAALHSLLEGLKQQPLPGTARFWQRVRQRAATEALHAHTSQQSLLEPTDVAARIDVALERLHASVQSRQALFERMEEAAQHIEQEVCAQLQLASDLGPAEGDSGSVLEGPTGRADQDLALLVTGTMDALEQEHVLMRLVDAEASLETPPAELGTYTTLWRLMPYIDDGTTAQLEALARRAAAVEAATVL